MTDHFRTSRATARSGYTLVEVLVAAALLAVAIAAAAALAGTMAAQEEINVRIIRALNLQEQATRLYQLGLSPTAITGILPPESGVTISFPSTNSLAVSGAGTVERATCRMTLNNSAPPITVTNEFVVIRPSIR